MPAPLDRPRLRPVEAFPGGTSNGQPLYVVRDPTGLAEGLISLSPVAMFILSLLDGQHSLLDIQEVFARRTGQLLPREHLEDMIGQLDAAHFLDSPGFAQYFQSLVDGYRSAAARLSAGEESYGVEPGGLGPMLQQMLFDGQGPPAKASRALVGLIAPHLDYLRGSPGYGWAYRVLAAADRPTRVIVLGTNHFGRAAAPVATRKDFQTPLGLTRTDRVFIETLGNRLGVDLCEDEFDHQREHSVELQVIVLQHLLGADRFEIVPVLCSDPCGPNGTAPADGRGADLREFGEALGELARGDGKPTLIVAGADLSHIGYRFGDEADLDEPFLGEVERKDRQALDALVTRGRDAFIEVLNSRDNSTRVCSAGCIYALTTALPDARPELLGYHQTADRESGTGVTCAALAFWGE
jgi:MEMO1 family protein